MKVYLNESQLYKRRLCQHVCTLAVESQAGGEMAKFALQIETV